MNKLPERIRIKDIARLADVSVGTVDRVIHGRSGVSEASKKRVEEILKQLDYQPNMYASALASNKKYTFICLLPQHLEGEYWTAVELGIHEAIATYSDFNTSVKINYYDPYDYHSFVDASEAILTQQPDGVMVAPTAPQYTKGFTDQLQTLDIPYIYIRYIQRLQLISKAFRILRSRRGHHHSVRLLSQDSFAGVYKRMIVVWIVIVDLYRGIEVRVGRDSFVDTQFYCCPVFAFQMLRQKTDECVLLVGSQGTGIHVRLIVKLLQNFFHPFFACF